MINYYKYIEIKEENMEGIFITFEGGEGSGKTTIIKRLASELASIGYNPVCTREPGGSKIAEGIRSIILDKENTEMDYMTEALLYAASRAQHLSEVVRPSLELGKVVICDRYVDSSLAYQGYARGLGIDKVYDINLYATNGLLPKLTVFVDINPSVGLERIKTNHRDEDRLDKEKLSFHELVHSGYLEVAKRFPERIKVVNGEQTIEEVYNDVRKIVFECLGVNDEL